VPISAQPVHYLPIATTLVAIPFAASLFRRYRGRREALHLLWWGAGVACFGLGTALESTISLSGNSPFLNRAWYVAGAVLGAYPLAHGSAYLLLERRTAHRLTCMTLPLAIVLSILVLVSPIDEAALEATRPGGDALGWRWLRYVTPLLNTYAAGMLVGGAAWSSIRYFRTGDERSMAIGNALIAVGAILPALGGGAAKAGFVEALYVAEFFGLALIAAGYVTCLRR
jgi:hypothetical protein